MCTDMCTERNFYEFDSPEWKLLSQVSRPSRYSGSEWREYSCENDWESASLRICLTFPDVYEIGMSYYGFQIINSFVKSLGKNYLVDRAYSVWGDMAAKMRENDLQIYSVERKKFLSEFDVIAFTLPHEAAYTNILTILQLAGLEIRTENRRKHDPLIIAGGYGAYVPEPVSKFIDLFCVGDSEAVLPELLEVLSEAKDLELSERLELCKNIPGVYIPSIHKNCRIHRQVSEKFFMPSSMIVPSVSVVHDRAAIELFRGCGRGCRFCQAGMVNRPVRESDVNKAGESIMKILRSTGWDEVGLLSLASCDYSGIESLIDNLSGELSKRKARLSLPSLRMDGFSVGLAERLSGVNSRRGGITFAPEAGTQRMRDVINKGLTDEMIMNCLGEIFSRGWERVKLYFMMGLPTETQEDLRAISELARRTLRLGRSMGRKRVTVSVSVSGFVPKAHTPFQWERQNSIEELRDKGRFIKSENHEHNITIAYHEPEQTFLEGVLSRGDVRTCDVIEHAWRNGAEFDNWTECFDLNRWLNAFESLGIDPNDYTRERSESEILPWDFIDVGITKEFLLRERHKAYDCKLTIDCKNGCGACGLNCVKS